MDSQFIDELYFFGSNHNPDPTTDDLLDTVSPPELSQVESIDDDEYPPAQYDSPVDNVNPTSDSLIGNHMSDGTKVYSVSVSMDSGLLYFLFTEFLLIFGRFLLFLDGSIPPRLIFPVPFCWMQGYGVFGPSLVHYSCLTSSLGSLHHQQHSFLVFATGFLAVFCVATK